MKIKEHNINLSIEPLMAMTVAAALDTAIDSGDIPPESCKRIRVFEQTLVALVKELPLEVKQQIQLDLMKEMGQDSPIVGLINELHKIIKQAKDRDDNE